MGKSEDKDALLKHVEGLFLFDDKRKWVRIEVEEYQETIEAFDAECIPNFYDEASKNDEFDFENITYTLILYRTLWGFLFVNRDSLNDIKLLIKSLEQNSKEATNRYLQDKINKSYNEFKSYLYDKYGFNADDFKDNELSHSSNYYYHKDSADIAQYNSKIKITADEIYFDGLYPHYHPKYNYPSLKQLQNNKVSFEFSILDDETEIIKELKKILKLEKRYRRREISSTTNEIYNQLNLSNNNKFQSKKILTQALIIYKYLQYTKSIKQAISIYNFHVLYSNTENFNTYTYENTNAVKFDKGKSNIQCFDMASNDNFISVHIANKEIRLQIKQIKSMLNL